MRVNTSWMAPGANISKFWGRWDLLSIVRGLFSVHVRWERPVDVAMMPDAVRLRVDGEEALLRLILED